LIPQGESAALPDAAAVRARYERVLDAVVDAGTAPSVLTTVIDLTVTPPAIVRQGAGDPVALGLVAAGTTELG
jgi:tRNA A37 threonylcarbamoyladenosine synthetase subunit TsaC/SUA5/YrdC